MGAYVNPPGSKEYWLSQMGKSITESEAKAHTDFKENMLVTLLDNGLFKAAHISYDKRELEEAVRDDGRMKTFFTVPKVELLKVSNLETYL